MPERAEIEAVARELRAIVRDSFNTPAGRSDEFFRERAEKILDRVRDARDDEEAVDKEASLSRLRAAAPGLTGRLARHPQGEDHEAGIEAGIRGWEAAEDAGHTRIDVLLRRAIQDYLSRVSPSRDGTVAVDQPEPDALGGLPPSQPKEDA